MEVKVKQEPVGIFIAEYKLENEDYYIPDGTIKNEFVSIKQENADDNIQSELQQTVIYAKSETVDDADMKCSLAEINDIKQSIKDEMVKNEVVSIKQENCDDKIQSELQQTIFINAKNETVDPDVKCNLAEINDLKQSRKGTSVKWNNMKLLPGGPTDEKSFRCEVCTKTFTQKGTLNIHMRCHTGIKPFKCDICSKTFTQKCTLTVHMRSHTGDKPFKCDICLKTFSQKVTLNVHMRYHTGKKPFKCDVCSKTFTEKCTLNLHMRCHTGDKPFKCEICSKSFSQKCNLNKHALCHKDEK